MKTKGKAYLNKPSVIMKKLILMLVVLMGVIVDVSAIKLFGIEIHVKKGTLEWDATRTFTECVGKGLCEFTIKGSADIGGIYSGGTLGFDESGRFGLSLPKELLQDPRWSDTFVRGQVTINKDIYLSNEITSKIRNCPTKIKAGIYSISQEGNFIFIFF
jgi:hypothetical protein